MDVAEVNTIPEPAKAKLRLKELKRTKRPAALFDQFWAEGELALLHGATAMGKSVLAMQLADALAKGSPIEGFEMPKGRRKVLYVDLAGTDEQFALRYRGYSFGERLYYARPETTEGLLGWLTRQVAAHKFQVVVIDDLSAVKRTSEGTRETLELMRRLKQMCREHKVSILTLMESAVPREDWETERALGRSRILCTVADSVFAIVRKRKDVHGDRSLTQTRRRAGQIYWSGIQPMASIKRLETGMLGFVFDSRFTKGPDDETKELIRTIYWKHEDGLSFRAIAEQLGISKTQAHKLSKRWTPAMGGRPPEPETEAIDNDDDDLDDNWLPEEDDVDEQPGRYYNDPYYCEPEPEPDPRDYMREMLGHRIDPRLHFIFDHEPALNSVDEPIFVVERSPNDGKPLVWYHIQNDNIVRRKVRDNLGTIANIVRPEEVGCNSP